MTNNYTPTTSYLNPIYNISQLIQLTKYISHPSIYPQLHTKQLSLNYTLFNTSTNQIFTSHHKTINQLLQSPPISNSNFSPPPLSLQLQSQPIQPQPIQYQPQQYPQYQPQPIQSQPQQSQTPPVSSNPQETPPIS